jgi:hypothetical protein
MVNADVGVEFLELSFEQLANQRVIVCDDHVQRWSAGHGFIVPLDIVPTQAIMAPATWATARAAVTIRFAVTLRKRAPKRAATPSIAWKKECTMDRSQSGED